MWLSFAQQAVAHDLGTKHSDRSVDKLLNRSLAPWSFQNTDADDTALAKHRHGALVYPGSRLFAPDVGHLARSSSGNSVLPKRPSNWSRIHLKDGQCDIAANTLTILDKKGSSVLYLPNVFGSLGNWTADDMFFELRKEVPWTHGKVSVFNSPDKLFWEPRLTALYGDFAYPYSGRVLEANRWNIAPDVLLLIKQEVEDILGLDFNVVLLNRYRNGTDSNGWHQDNETVYGKNPEIASVTLAPDINPPRDFVMKELSSGLKLGIQLEHGSLLWMGGAMQHYWKHTLPKRKKVEGERINLTFRKVVTPFGGKQAAK